MDINTFDIIEPACSIRCLSHRISAHSPGLHNPNSLLCVVKRLKSMEASTSTTTHDLMRVPSPLDALAARLGSGCSAAETESESEWRGGGNGRDDFQTLVACRFVVIHPNSPGHDGMIKAHHRTASDHQQGSDKWWLLQPPGGSTASRTLHGKRPAGGRRLAVIMYPSYSNTEALIVRPE